MKAAGIIMLLFFSCDNFSAKEKISKEENRTHSSVMAMDTVLSGDKKLQNVNGIWYYNCRPFSGCIKEMYAENLIKRVASYTNGMQQGWSHSYYPNGQLWEERCYSQNKCNGRHTGWWENGIKKFEYTYSMDKRNGEFTQWYRSGKLYSRLHYKHDIEYGRQQAWRENGKLYLNYEVKDGYRYGLQKSALCYTLTEGKIKSKSPVGN